MKLARILTLDEVIRMGDELMWLEYKTSSMLEPQSVIYPTSPYDDNLLGRYSVSFQCGHVQIQSLYGRQWRCWTAKPSEEQRKAAKWNEVN